MAQVLEEFLVNVKYAIDSPSQQTFFDALKRVASSVAGLAGEITGLGVALLTLSEKMAAAGEKLYWSSQRIGNSVTEVQNMAFAMSNLGMSADAAMSGIERFSSWTSNMGPAATSYLRTLGVTATDTVGRMRQLGEYFRSQGGTADKMGTLEYALAIRRAQLMGIDENTMLALSSGKMEQGIQQAGLVQRLVWGKDWQKGPDKFAEQSQKVMNQFREMGLIFQNLAQWLGLGLFTKIMPDLEDINRLLIRIMPDIKEFLTHLIDHAPALLHFLEGAIKGFDVLVKLGSVAIETFDKLPVALQRAAEAFLLLPKAFELLRSPMFWILGGLTALLLLLDDYQGWQRDQEDKTGKTKTSHFDWGGADKMFKGIGEALEPLNKIRKELDYWFCCLTGINGLFTTVAATLGLILGKMVLTKGFSLVGSLLGGLLGLGGGKAAGAAWGESFLWALGRTILTRFWPVAVAIGWYEMLANGFDYLFGKASTPQRADGPHPGDSDANLAGRGGGANREGMKPLSTPTHQGNVRGGGGPASQRGQAGANFGEWVRRKWHEAFPNAPIAMPPKGEQHSSLNPDGSYKTASIGDDWNVPAGFGGATTSANESDRFFDMLRLGFDVANEKLGNIFDTLTDMAEAMGAGHGNRDASGAAGGGGDGGGDSTFGPMLGPHASPEEQEARLKQIMHRESGGQNILNRMGPGGAPASTASGYWQMIDSTWLWAAQRAGIDTRRYPRAISAPFELQHRAALALMDAQGERPWAASAPHLSHQPIGGGVDAGAVLRERHRQSSNGSNLGGVHSQVSLYITAPNPASAAAQTIEAQNRVFEHHVRFAKGTLLA